MTKILGIEKDKFLKLTEGALVASVLTFTLMKSASIDNTNISNTTGLILGLVFYLLIKIYVLENSGDRDEY